MNPTPSLQERYAPQGICFGCGPANPKGLRIRSLVEGDASPSGEAPEVTCRFTPEDHHQAFEGMINGGILGALLDCHSNWAAAYVLMTTRGVGEPPCTVTAEFHVKLRRPTPTGVELFLRARAVEVSDPKVLVEATVEASIGGETKITSTCRGVFVAVREGHPAYHRW